jgi:hypothetical protein
MSNDNNGWSEWSKVVLTELERLTESNQKIIDEFQKFKVEIAKDIASKSEVEHIRKELSDFKIEKVNNLNELRTVLTKEITDGKAVHSKELAELKNSHEIQITEIKSELKFKAGVWGALAGLVPVVIGLGLWVLKLGLG